MKKSKIAALTLAGTLAVSAMLAGTYAWQSISQLALNQVNEVVNPGARLHDDFNGIASYSTARGTDDAKVKNVYVENFTNAADGGQPVYARIRLEEYLEIGTGAGKATGNTAVSIESGAQLDNLSTWKVYQWDDDPTFRDYIEIGTGGSAVYMPTYNKNKDSLEADINGTLAGKNGAAYDDYVKYESGDSKIGVEIYDADDDQTDEAGTANITTEQLINAVIYTENDSSVNKNAGDLKITTGSTDITINTTDASGGSQTVTCPITVETDPGTPTKITAITVDLDNGVDSDADIRMVFVDTAHTAKTTQKANLISMTDWETAGSPLGNYWVCDTDGWAYWAKPIDPGETTGCLINQIRLKPSANISGEYYYGLNVRAQFATAGDWGNGTFTAAASTTNTLSGEGGISTQNADTGFYADGITENAMRLLEKVAGASKTVTITTEDPVAQGLKGGETATFSAKTMMGAVEIKDESITWSVEGKTSSNTTFSVNSNGTMTLKIGEDETAYSINVVATSKKEGETEKTVGCYIVSIKDLYTIEINVPNDATTLAQGYQATVTAKIAKRGKVDPYMGVTWSVESTDEDHPNFTDTDTAITPAGGVLTIGETEKANSLKITATCNADTSVTAEYEVTEIETKYEHIKTMPLATSEKLTIDGVGWYVMARQTMEVDGEQKECALLWAADVIRDSETNEFIRIKFDDSRGAWYNSDTGVSTYVKTYLNDEYLSNLSEISQKAVDTKLYIRANAKNNDKFYESTQKMFLLSEADIVGKNNSAYEKHKFDVDQKEYTVGHQLINEDNKALLEQQYPAWLRSMGYYTTGATYLTASGTVFTNDTYQVYGLRPAVWISID